MTLTHTYIVRISSSRGIFPGKAQKLLNHSNVEREYYHKERFT